MHTRTMPVGRILRDQECARNVFRHKGMDAYFISVSSTGFVLNFDSFTNCGFDTPLLAASTICEVVTE